MGYFSLLTTFSSFLFFTIISCLRKIERNMIIPNNYDLSGLFKSILNILKPFNLSFFVYKNKSDCISAGIL